MSSVDLPQEQPPDLRQYLAVLRIRWKAILLVTVVVVGAVMAFSFQRTPLYTSTARVWVKPILTAQQMLSPTALSQLNLDTERELVRSQAVAEEAAEVVGGTTGTELLEHVSVSVPTNSQILDVSYEAPEPLGAQRAAQAFAEGYIAFKRQAALDATTAASRSLERSVQELQLQLQAARAAAEDAPPNSSARTDAENQVSSLQTQIALVQSQVAQLGGISIDPGTVVQQATLPTSPSSPNHPLNAALGVLLGLALGVGLAFVRERLDESVRGREDLENQIGAPVLAMIPKYRVRRDKSRRELLVTLDDPNGAASEAYRTLRTSVQFLSTQKSARTIMVAGAAHEEGKTTTAANLAVVLAQAGKRVILLSGDLRKPKLDRYFRNDWVGSGEWRRGLSNVIAGEVTVQEALRQTQVPNLWVIPAGPVSGTPAEMASSERMALLLETLRASADYTIIDTAPVLLVTDALAMASHVDAVLFVASPDIERGTIGRARIQLQQVGANVVGAVLNKFVPSKSGAYDYTYRYTYRYVPEHAEGDAGGERGRRRSSQV